jgi:hypothetical protein
MDVFTVLIRIEASTLQEKQHYQKARRPQLFRWLIQILFTFASLSPISSHKIGQKPTSYSESSPSCVVELKRDGAIEPKCV